MELHVQIKLLEILKLSKTITSNEIGRLRVALLVWVRTYLIGDILIVLSPPYIAVSTLFRLCLFLLSFVRLQSSSEASAD